MMKRISYLFAGMFLLLSLQSHAQLICAKKAHIEAKVTHPLVLEYETRISICDQLEDLEYLIVDMDGAQYEYKFFACDPEKGEVSYFPTGTEPESAAFELLKLIFPNGHYSIFGMNKETNVGELAECARLPEPMPTLSEWGLMILTLLSLIIGLVFIRKWNFQFT